MPLRDDRRSVDQDILDIIPERFDSDPDSRHARKGAHTRLILTIALALLAVAALGVAGRHLFFGNATKEQMAGTTVIKADERPIKTKPAPDDRGGMDVPNRDKLVYQHLGANESEPQRESLLPPPEQPQAPPAQQPRSPTIKPAFPPPPAHDAAAKPVAPEPSPVLPSPAPATPTVLTPPPGVASVKPAAGAAKSTPAPAPAPVTSPSAPSSAGGNWLVQLGALKNDADARAEWNRIHAANKDVLGGFSSDIVRVDLGAKGIFWRLRAGPMGEAEARTVCAQLAKRNQGCIIARK